MMRGVILATVMLTAGMAQAKAPLSAVREINDGLVAVAVADHIRSKCPEIGARMMVAWRYINALEDQARGMGYSEDEIEDFVTDKGEKARVAGVAAHYIHAHDADPRDGASLCALGHAEIAANSVIGQLLRAQP